MLMSPPFPANQSAAPFGTSEAADVLEPQPAALVFCVQAVLQMSGAAPRSSTMRHFSTFLPVCTASEPPSGVFMGGVAWIPGVALLWRWTLAFVNWGISPYRFCPRCSRRSARLSGSIIGNHGFFARKYCGAFLLNWCLKVKHIYSKAAMLHQPFSPKILCKNCFFFSSSVLQLFRHWCGCHWQQDWTSDGKRSRSFWTCL